MMLQSGQFILRCLLFVLSCAVVSGCGSLRLPAIDPTGERIFLSNPSYTTLVSPYDSVSPYSCFPKPAFTEPPPVPPCTGQPGVIPGATGTGVAREPPQPRLLLTPSKIVAPVNSEVILLAGICGGDGYYVTKQPIEWMLSPDSVGNILALPDSAHPHIAKLVDHSSRKECNTLAITRTTTAAGMITRGTAQPNDDVWVGKGQTWISVSSPTEGISHVTALAKGEENWDFRRQTATIHWVDMQWAFPAPQIVRAGQPSTLTTTVSRTSSGGPATGVLVRYDVIEGTEASFTADGRTSIELPTNENGRADVQVVQNQLGPGMTKVRIQVLSADLRTGSDRAVIGQGFTTITWSAPGLTVTVAGAGTVARNSIASYRVDVANPGDIATRDVQVQVEIPPAMKYLNSQPPAQVFGDKLVWRLGTLGPKQAIKLDINCQTANAGEVQIVVRAVSPDATEAIGRAATRIVESSLSIRFVDPPQTATVGQVVGFNFEVTNTGGTVLQNVFIKDVFDAGLQPNYAGVDPNRPLELPAFSLTPGETKQQSVSFAVRRAGQLCHAIEATAVGGHVATQRACMDVTQPVLKVEVRKTGPDQARVGDQVPFTITVTNTGEGVLTNVRITDTPDKSLRPAQGTANYQIIENGIVWGVDTLGPSRTIKLELVCACERENPAAINTVLVTADGGVRQSATAGVAISPALRPTPAVPAQPPTQPPVNNNPPPTTNVTGEFKVTIVGAANGIRVGEVGTFFVFLKNERNVADSDVIVRLQLPDGLEYVRHTWSSNLQLLSNPNNQRTIEIGPILSIGAGQTNLQPIKVDLRGTKPGNNYEIKVDVRSRGLAQPVQNSTKTFVSAQ